MAQKQSKEAEEGKAPLVCTYGDCQKLQAEGGEFCKLHGEPKKCLYCDNMTGNNPHFQSACCGRGMCDDCYDGLVGTDEQFQIDGIDDEEDYNRYVKGRKFPFIGDYLCFECTKNY